MVINYYAKEGMKKILALLLTAGLAVGCLAGCGSNEQSTPGGSSGQAGTSGEARELTISIGNPEGSDNYYKYQAFADALAEVSGGQLTAKVYASGTLATDSEALEALTSGTVDIAHLTPSTACSMIPDVAAMDLPGVFSYEDTEDTTTFIEFEAALHDTLDSIYSDYNLKYLALNQSCQAVIVSNEKLVKSPADLEGKAYRSAGQYLGRLFELWGASATTMDMGDLTTGLERNMVQGTLTAYGVVGSFKLYEVAPYVTFFNTTNSVASMVMAGDTWNSLSAEEQAWVEEASKIYLTEGQKIGQEYLEKYTQQFYDGNAEVYYLTEAEEAAFLDDVDTIFEEISKNCTDKGLKLIDLIKDWNAK